MKKEIIEKINNELKEISNYTLLLSNLVLDPINYSITNENDVIKITRYGAVFSNIIKYDSYLLDRISKVIKLLNIEQ